MPARTPSPGPHATQAGGGGAAHPRTAARGRAASPCPMQPMEERSAPAPLPAGPARAEFTAGSNCPPDAENDAEEDDDIDGEVPLDNSGGPLPRKGRWSQEEEVLLLNAYSEYEATTDRAQTRKTVLVETSSSEADVGGKKVPKLKKQRTNVAQEGFRRDAKRWKFIADRFSEGLVQKPTPQQCKTKIANLRAQYLAIGRCQSRTGRRDYWEMDKTERKEQQGRDKNMPLSFTHDLWVLCDQMIGAKETVHYKGAFSGDTGRAEAFNGAKVQKRYYTGGHA